MALVGKKFALISVGMSCQTVHQLHRALGLARELTGDPSLSKKSLPFDWMVCPPMSAAGILRDGEFFPESPDELRPYPLKVACDRSPYVAGWPKRNAFFWHEFTVLNGTIESGFRETSRKFRYLADSFRALRSKRVIAFLSNTQANFDMIERVTGVGPTLRASEVNVLKEALDSALGQRVPLCVVNTTIMRDESERFRAFSIRQTTVHWSGEERAWQPVIREFLSRPNFGL